MRDYQAAQDVARKVIVRKYPCLLNDVDDVLQDAAVKAIIHEDQYKGQSQWVTWFVSIAVNQAKMRLRLRWDMRRCELTELYPAKDDPEADAVQAERSRKLHEAARRLPRALRLEFPSYLAGDQAGEDGNRKGRRFRLRKRLREQLEGIV